MERYEYTHEIYHPGLPGGLFTYGYHYIKIGVLFILRPNSVGELDSLVCIGNDEVRKEMPSPF